jgi:hypothetical protein
LPALPFADACTTSISGKELIFLAFDDMGFPKERAGYVLSYHLF